MLIKWKQVEGSTDQRKKMRIKYPIKQYLRLKQIITFMETNGYRLLLSEGTLNCYVRLKGGSMRLLIYLKEKNRISNEYLKIKVCGFYLVAVCGFLVCYKNFFRNICFLLGIFSLIYMVWDYEWIKFACFGRSVIFIQV